VVDASSLRRLPHLPRLVGVHAERLLTEDVLASLDRGHRRLEMQDVRRTIIEHRNLWVLDDGAPVGDALCVPVAARCALHLSWIAAADGDE
jgi:hypothetical protein